MLNKYLILFTKKNRNICSNNLLMIDRLITQIAHEETKIISSSAGKNK